MGAVTDPGKEIKYDLVKKPGISNLLKIYSIFSKESIEELEEKYKGKGYEEFKRDLAKLLIKKLEVFRKKKRELEKRKVYLKEILKKGAERAEKIAKLTIKEVRERMGLEI
jgi:tryptophanyl-tRNA synthetase